MRHANIWTTGLLVPFGFTGACGAIRRALGYLYLLGSFKVDVHGLVLGSIAEVVGSCKQLVYILLCHVTTIYLNTAFKCDFPTK